MPLRKVLVVDDEPTLVASLKYNLEREGFQVLAASDGETALSIARSETPDIIVLDLMLPVMDGIEVCRILRRELTTPILMLTAKATEVDKVVGLEIGADDYLTKPFSMREFLARVKAILRRSDFHVSEVQMLHSGDLRIDLRRREAYKGDKPLPLKPKELELLAFFVRNKGRVFTRDQLLTQIWGYDYSTNTRTIDVHVRWLRQKIEADDDRPVRLVTVRGVGYRFEG
ncbi:MAG TPA: response regulator transcription factor [Dehalococcoidia bacterium]|nr:response regulator transcription factor [Dehalococcoidia bacterium]